MEDRGKGEVGESKWQGKGERIVWERKERKYKERRVKREEVRKRSSEEIGKSCIKKHEGDEEIIPQ